MIVFEDLGDLTLYSWLQCKRNPAKLKNFTKKLLKISHFFTGKYLIIVLLSFQSLIIHISDGRATIF